jgi:adenine-specific DNA methylase
MKESYGKGLATRTGPESCVDVREDRDEALTGVRAGRVFSRENKFLRGADAVRRGGRPYSAHRYREMHRGPARSETPSMCGNTSRENREVLCSPSVDGAVGRVGKSKDTRR